MRRQVAALFLAGALTLSLAGCSSHKTITNPTPKPTQAETPQATPDTPSPTPEATPVPATPSAEPAPTPTPAPTPAQSADERTWLDRDTAGISFGMNDPGACPLVVSDLRLGLDDVSVAFAPLATNEGLTAFLAADMRIPNTSVSYDGTMGVLTLKLYGVVLDAPAPLGDDWVFDFVNEHGLTYPVATDAGALGGDNRFFQGAVLSCDGVDTTIAMRLTTSGRQYHIESGTLDEAGYLPYFRVSFREA